jgi:hypothetical protein
MSLSTLKNLVEFSRIFVIFPKRSPSTIVIGFLQFQIEMNYFPNRYSVQNKWVLKKFNIPPKRVSKRFF